MEVASAAVAKSDATLFNFFMILLSREGAVVFCKTSEMKSESTGKPPRVETYPGADHRPTYCAIELSRNLFLGLQCALWRDDVASALQAAATRMLGSAARLPGRLAPLGLHEKIA